MHIGAQLQRRGGIDFLEVSLLRQIIIIYCFGNGKQGEEENKERKKNKCISITECVGIADA